MSTSPSSAPWSIHPRSTGVPVNDVVASDGKIVASVTEYGSEGRPNAELVKAAPDLADALETLLDIFLDGRLDELNEKEQAAYEKAEAALAKTQAA